MCYTILNKNEIGVDIVEGTLLEVKFNFSSGETYSIEGNYVLDFKILIYETEVSKWGTKKYVDYEIVLSGWIVNTQKHQELDYGETIDENIETYLDLLQRNKIKSIIFKYGDDDYYNPDSSLEENIIYYVREMNKQEVYSKGKEVIVKGTRKGQ